MYQLRYNIILSKSNRGKAQNFPLFVFLKWRSKCNHHSAFQSYKKWFFSRSKSNQKKWKTKRNSFSHKVNQNKRSKKTKTYLLHWRWHRGQNSDRFCRPLLCLLCINCLLLKNVWCQITSIKIITFEKLLPVAADVDYQT